jgi:solute carrier family 25 oxoglutarate transporter 11
VKLRNDYVAKMLAPRSDTKYPLPASQPANTTAVRMNLSSMQGKKFSFGNMIRENGVMSLYDGLAAGIWRQVFYASSRFGLFETCRDKLHEIRGKTDFAGR